MEVKAADAERASVKYKQVEYIKEFIGETFDGIISGVTEWGIYVEISIYRAEGLLRLANMGDDYYDYDQQNQWIIGRRSRIKYQLGDPIQVVVVAADIFKRQIDLSLTGAASMRDLGRRGSSDSRKRSEKGKDRGLKSKKGNRKGKRR
jgi:ribonuclease R